MAVQKPGPAKNEKPTPIRVRATAVGFYNNCRIKPGQEFMLKREQEFSKFWMERVTRAKATQVADDEETAKAADLGGDSDSVI